MRRDKQPNPKWTDDDIRRLDALQIKVWQYIKPAETTCLYGLRQRLSAKRLRTIGGPHKSPAIEEFAKKCPDLSASHCQFLLDVIQSVLNGEQSAFRVFGLNLSDKESSVAERLMAAEYILYCKAAGGKKTPLRDEIGARWGVNGSRVSQVKSAHETDIEQWIKEVLELTAKHNIPDALVVRRLLDQVAACIDRHRQPNPKTGKKGKEKTHPENFFLVEFPVPVKKI